MKEIIYYTILSFILVSIINSCSSEEVESVASVPPQYILTVTAGEGGSVIPTPAEHTTKEARLHLQQLRMKDMWLIGG